VEENSQNDRGKKLEVQINVESGMKARQFLWRGKRGVCDRREGLQRKTTGGKKEMAL